MVPTRRNVRTPSWASSSTAIDVDGPPMPVEHTTIGTSPIHASHDVNSRCDGERGRPFHRRRDPLDPRRIAGHDRQRRALEIVVFQSEVEDTAHRTHGTRAAAAGETHGLRRTSLVARVGCPGQMHGVAQAAGRAGCGSRGRPADVADAMTISDVGDNMKPRAVELQHVSKHVRPGRSPSTTSTSRSTTASSSRCSGRPARARRRCCA